MLTSQLDDSGVEGVLGGTVQVSNTFLNGGNAIKDGGGEGNVVLDAVFKVVKSVDLGEEEHLGVGGPEEDNLVVTLLAILDVSSEEIDELLVSAGADVISAVSLVGGDKVGVENGFHGHNVREVVLELVEEGRFENVRFLGTIVKVVLVDVPTANIEVDRVDHRE